MNLFEKLNRLDDSLVESKRIVKKKKLTESVEDDFDYSDFIPEEMTQFFCINEEDNEDPNKYMPEKGYRGYKAVASLIACGDYAEDLRDCGYQYALLINDPADNFFVGYVAGDRIYKLTEEDIYDQIGIDYDDDIDEMLTENRWNPYFTPYGYRDAAKVLNGKAPEYYYHLKHIEMDTGDGIKLARYALRKGLPVMVDKNSDPDYPEFAIKGEYHWNDYFYTYPTAHEEDLIAWDGKMFVEEQLTEGSNTIPSDDYYVITTTEGGKRYYIRNDIDFKNPPEDAYEWFTHDLDKAQLFSSRKMAGEYFSERDLGSNVFALDNKGRKVRYYDYVKTPYEIYIEDTL